MDPQSSLDAVLYAVLRGVSRKSGYVNASNAWLATKTGFSAATITRSLKALSDRGLIKCQYRRLETGTDRRIRFSKLGSIYTDNRTNQSDECYSPNDRTNQSDECPTHQRDEQTIITTTNVERNEDHRARAHTHAREGKANEDTRTNDYGKNGAPKDTRALNNEKQQPVSNSQETLAERDASLDAWWTDTSASPPKIGIFEHIWSHWPKQSYREDAMAQFRAAFDAEFVSDPNFGNRLWKIVQWQVAQWEKEGRELRYTPSFANWIKRGQWKDAPQEVGA